jgi:hypothetical protein
MPNNDKSKQEQHPEDNTAINTGNASNPEPAIAAKKPNQLLHKKAEKYLRESGNIEDYPDAQDEEEAEEQKGA